MQTHSEAFLRQRKFILVLPLLVLPFLAMAFWALGGGSGDHTGSGGETPVPGLNLQLPEPRLREGGQPDKLSLYREEKRKLGKQKSPGKASLLQRMGFGDVAESPPKTVPGTAAQDILPGDTGLSSANLESFESPLAGSREAEIDQRLTQLTRIVNQAPSQPAPGHKRNSPAPSRATTGDEGLRQDIERLENLMQTLGPAGQSGKTDPEMQQLEGMLERILDIQHPERVAARLRQQSLENKRQVVPLQPQPVQAAVTLLQNPPGRSHPSYHADSLLAVAGQHPPGGTFYDLETGYTQAATAGNVLQAAIHDTQTVTAGSTVRLRLLQEAYLGGRLLEKGTLLHGTCRIQGERLLISVAAVQAGNAVLPVALSVHDLDGMEGLYVPGAIHQQAASQGADRVIQQGLPLPTLSPSLGAQAASAGIEAAKGLFSRKARLVTVTLPAGHQLLLIDQNSQL